MYRSDSNSPRRLQCEEISSDLVIVGGGLAGTCAAITAARAGLKTVLVQDRPVLGGNASSEVRLWILGATSHMGNNNRWAREGGVVNEILLECAYRNPEGNPLIFDTIMLEKVVSEPNLTLLLNTAAHDVEMREDGTIGSVTAFCSQNSMRYVLNAPLFCDASGDGIVGFLSGAAFRIGAEARDEFEEPWAPAESHQELLGHSLYFYTRDTGKPVRFTPPSYALKDISKIPRYRQFNTKDYGCHLWWIEYGGSRDTVHETEEIKWELWKIVYGVWDYIKNSGEFPDAETLTLDWVGQLPGKRESRRFEGDYMLTQQDIVAQRRHYDAVSFGGWAMDLHPVDAIYSDETPCTQWHSKGVYQVPYRCLYSRNIPNLFLAGRIISASHIAFGSTRVMATCAHNAQAIAIAAAICRRDAITPKQLAAPERVAELQRRLLGTGQHIPHVALTDPRDLAQSATITASSELQLDSLRAIDETVQLTQPYGLLLPLEAGEIPKFSFHATADENTELVAELRTCSRAGSYTPDVVLERLTIPVSGTEVRVPHQRSVVGSASRVLRHQSRQKVGGNVLTSATQPEQSVLPQRGYQDRLVRVPFTTRLEESGYAMICLMANEHIRISLSDQLVTGVTSIANRQEVRVAKGAVQDPPSDIGVERFEFWTPSRRPDGKNLAFVVDDAISSFKASQVINGIVRPTLGSNAWVASFADPQPSIKLSWESQQTINRIELSFDPDYDHPLEQVLTPQPERIMPYCVRSFRIYDATGRMLFEETGNHQARYTVRLPEVIATESLTIDLDAPLEHVPAALFEVRCYGPE